MTVLTEVCEPWGVYGGDDRCVIQKVTYVLIGSRSKLCNLIIQQAF